MNVEAIQELVGTGRRFPLRYTFAAYSLPVLSGLFFGIALGPTLDIAAGRPFGDVHLIEFTILTAVLTIAARVLFIAKRQGKVEVVLDDEGIRELDDGAIRVSIPWENAHASVEKVRLRYRAARFELVNLRFAAPTGEVITITDHDEGGLFPRHRFRVLAREDLTIEKKIAALLPPLPPEALDPRLKAETGTGAARFVRRVLALFTFASLAVFCGHLGVQTTGGEPPTTLEEAARVVFTVIWGLGPALELIAQVVRWSRWSTRAAALSATWQPEVYRAPARRDDAGGYARLMERRAMTFIALRSTLFLIAILLPWVAGAVLESACQQYFVGSFDTRCPR